MQSARSLLTTYDLLGVHAAKGALKVGACTKNALIHEANVDNLLVKQ